MTQNNTIEEICINYELSRVKRENEIKIVGHDKGCQVYINLGCYSCDGKKVNCTYYLNKHDFDE